MGIPLLPWPACSPDLNPIEHIWAIIKQRLGQYRRKPTSRAAMYEAIQNEWDRLTYDEILAIVDSMPRRIQACIEANGGVTKY